MSDAFVKVFAKMLKSSIWNEDPETRIIWVTILMIGSDTGGVVIGNARSLARDANILDADGRFNVAKVEQALAKFMAPDPESRTPDNEGRRIEVVQGGWKILNYQKYLELMSKAERNEYQRFMQAKYRAQKKMREGMRNLKSKATEEQIAQAIDAMVGKTFTKEELLAKLIDLHGPFQLPEPSVSKKVKITSGNSSKTGRERIRERMKAEEEAAQAVCPDHIDEDPEPVEEADQEVPL